MNVGSLFTGIGGFDLGLERADLRIAWQCEIDPACRKLLAHRWPDVPCYDDVRKVTANDASAVDVLCGGFPCQDLSVAGRRAGLAGERSGLFWEFTRVAAELTPRWILLENVPGLLSSNDGRDMAAVLGRLEELGYGWAYRVLDAQYWGVAQRRRRVFVVGHPRAERAAQVLFERESVPRDSATGPEARQAVAGTLGGGAGGSGWRDDLDRAGAFIPVARTLTAHERWDGESETFIPIPLLAAGAGGANGAGVGALGAPMFTLDTTGAHAIGFNARQDPDHWLNATGPLDTDGTTQAVASCVGVRRLTPTECERLQGFPDGWTDVDGAADSVRYRQLGNAVCVPVAEWIGRRILQVEPSPTSTQRKAPA